MTLHVDAGSAKGHALQAQTEGLFGGIFTAELNGSAGADHAMPGQPFSLMENAHNLTRTSGPACGFRDGSVS